MVRRGTRYEVCAAAIELELEVELELELRDS